MTPLKRWLPTLAMINHSIVSTNELNCSVKQRTGAAGESRGGLHTLPNRHRPKPRIDCEAILGKLSERIRFSVVRGISVVRVVRGIRPMGLIRLMGK